MLTFGPARTDDDLRAILALQQLNLPQAISPAEAREQGFLTVEHDLPLLREMNEPYGHALAWDGPTLAGYALAMMPHFGNQIPMLQPFFDRLNQLAWAGCQLSQWRYCLMGQVCVAKDYRGQGVFAGVYQELGRHLSPHFDLLVTEIAVRNTRSIRAHAKIGFVDMQRYTDPDGADWVIVGWPLSERISPP